MKSPKEIIDRLFNEARAKEPDRFKSINEEAAFLDMSAGHLSRIKNSRVALTDDVIDRIVDAFTAGNKDESYRAQLKRELIMSRDKFTVGSSSSTTTEVSVAKGAVSQFFNRYSMAGCLLCCEYRDRPQVNDIRGAFPEVASDAAKAVASGLAYAFFQPFGDPERIAEAMVECVKQGQDPVGLHYLLDVAMEVRNAYSKVRRLAEEINPHIQMALYEANQTKIEVSGIQSRLFYVDFPDQKKQRNRKIYQWISGVDNHYFIERDKETISVGALAEQFLPITTYWSQNNRLPVTEEELQEASKTCGGIVKWSIWNHSAAQAAAAR